MKYCMVSGIVFWWDLFSFLFILIPQAVFIWLLGRQESRRTQVRENPLGRKAGNQLDGIPGERREGNGRRRRLCLASTDEIEPVSRLHQTQLAFLACDLEVALLT